MTSSNQSIYTTLQMAKIEIEHLKAEFEEYSGCKITTADAVLDRIESEMKNLILEDEKCK